MIIVYNNNNNNNTTTTNNNYIPFGIHHTSVSALTYSFDKHSKTVSAEYILVQLCA